MSRDLQDTIDEAIDDLREWCKDNPDCDPTYDGTLHEFADGSVPVYTGDLMQLAADNIDLATATPSTVSLRRQTSLPPTCMRQ